MKAKVRRAGRKPQVAFSNHDAAVSNIAAKRDALTRLADTFSSQGDMPSARNEEQTLLLDSLPTSARRFNGWSSAALPQSWRCELGSFTANGHKTLLESGLYESVLAALAAIRAIKTPPKTETHRQETVARLRREVQLSVLLRQIAERELIRLKTELHLASKQNEDLKAKLQSAEFEGLRVAERKRTGMDSRSSTNAVPLRGRRGHRGEGARK